MSQRWAATLRAALVFLGLAAVLYMLGVAVVYAITHRLPPY